MSHRAWRAAALVVGLLSAGAAAAARAQLTFGARVELVRLPVSATKGPGSFVTDLDASDFRIYEDGVLQDVDFFSRSSAPLDLVLLLDISGSMEERLIQVQMAATRFVRSLRPEDRVQIAQFKDRVTVLQDFTSDREALEAAIKKTAAYGSTALHNALYTAIRTLRQMPAQEVTRRAIVVLSDGDDTASVVSDDQVLDFARRSEVALYAIGLEAWRDRSEQSAAIRLLAALARETGGHLLLAESVGQLDTMYERIAEELRTQYTLGYGSASATSRDRWRRIEVRVASRRGVQVRHRLGYYARSGQALAALPPPPAPMPEAPPPPAPEIGDPASEPAQVAEGPEAAEAAEPPPAEWMALVEGVLEMQLAHREQDDGDLGVLAVDPVRRTVEWRSAEGPGACSKLFSVGIDAVESASAAPDLGLLLSLATTPPRTLQFLPAPYAAWFPPTPGIKSSQLPSRMRAETRVAVRSLLEALGRAPTADEESLYAFYGAPVSVDLADLLRSPGEYEGRTVRVHGRFDPSGGGGSYLLRSEGTPIEVTDSFEYVIDLAPRGDATVSLSPLRDIRAFVASRAEAWARQTVEILGVFRRESLAESSSTDFGIKFWQVRVPEAAVQERAVTGQSVTVDLLARGDGRFDGEIVRVIGRFRAGNLHGDLANETRRGVSDWVIKHGNAALWVTGKPASGPGWSLDMLSAQDSLAWLEVVGRPRTIKGVTYLSAMDVAPAAAPSQTASAAPTAAAVRVYGPPVVTFALPGDGDAVAADARFVIQFSNPMDVDSLTGRVELRYPDVAGAGFERLRVVYSERSRHIVVDPGEPLRPGGHLECRLLRGIVDFEGRPLVPRAGEAEAEAIDVIRFEVGS